MKHTRILPTAEEFKASAKQTQKNGIGNYSYALDKEALKYGYKNYNAIKRFLKEDTFPMHIDIFIRYLEKHLALCSIPKGGGDYFMQKGLDFAKVIFNAFYKDAENKMLYSRSDLENKMRLFQPKRFLLLCKCNPDDKTLEELALSIVGSSYLDEVYKNISISPKEYHRILNTPDMFWTVPLDILENRLGFMDIQQLRYYHDAIRHFVMLLSNGELNEEYYKLYT